ncbi:MAG: methionine biosynthesis protein MetW [Promethearchaeota archaeon]
MLKRKDLQIICEYITLSSRVLDLGCGDGQLLYELVKEKKVKGLGIEISIDCIKSCLEKGLSVIQEDLNEGLKDFQNKSFDYIILSQTLEYISSPDNLIKEMLRVGEHSFISFENLANWRNRVSFLFKGRIKSSKNGRSIINGKKQQLLTVKSFLELCKKKGFNISSKIYLPKRRFNLTNIFPNLFSRTAIFILKSN